MQKIVIKIPMLPVSVNNQYGKSRWGNVFLTKDAKVYREQVGWIAKDEVRKQGWKIVEKAYIQVTAIYVMPIGSRQDIQNDKLSFDSLEGIVYRNDNQIVDIRMIKTRSKNYQETILIIKKLTKNYYGKFSKKLLEKANDIPAGEGGKV